MSELDLAGLRKVAEAASHPCAEWELSMASDGPGSIRLTSTKGSGAAVIPGIQTLTWGALTAERGAYRAVSGTPARPSEQSTRSGDE